MSYYYFHLGRETDEAYQESNEAFFSRRTTAKRKTPCQDTWAKLAIAYGYESDGFITVHPKVR